MYLSLMWHVFIFAFWDVFIFTPFKSTQSTLKKIFLCVNLISKRPYESGESKSINWYLK